MTLSRNNVVYGNQCTTIIIDIISGCGRSFYCQTLKKSSFVARIRSPCTYRNDVHNITHRPVRRGGGGKANGEYSHRRRLRRRCTAARPSVRHRRAAGGEAVTRLRSRGAPFVNACVCKTRIIQSLRGRARATVLSVSVPSTLNRAPDRARARPRR